MERKLVFYGILDGMNLASYRSQFKENQELQELRHG